MHGTYKTRRRQEVAIGHKRVDLTPGTVPNFLIDEVHELAEAIARFFGDLNDCALETPLGTPATQSNILISVAPGTEG